MATFRKEEEGIGDHVEKSSRRWDETQRHAAAAWALLATGPTAESMEGEDPDERRRAQLQQASQRARKRHKDEAMQCTAQTSAIRLEIERLQREIATASPEVVAAAVEAVETHERAEFLREKLRAHHEWTVELHRLLASAPLLDLAVRLRELQEQQEEEETKDQATGTEDDDTEEAVDEWRRDSLESQSPQRFITYHVKHAVALSQEKARNLLDEFQTGECDFAVNFHSRGWTHAASFESGLLTFSSARAMASVTVDAIASAVWRSLQFEDILRTFVPLVQDVTVAYESESQTSSVSQRVVQLDASFQSRPIATIESMEMVAIDSVHGWQIVVETCDDPWLVAYAADRLTRESSPSDSGTKSPPIPSVSLAKDPDFVIAIRCSPHAQSTGVHVQIAGSIRHGSAQFMTVSVHVDLVQYLVDMMPVYEELHLLARS